MCGLVLVALAFDSMIEWSMVRQATYAFSLRIGIML